LGKEYIVEANMVKVQDLGKELQKKEPEKPNPGEVPDETSD
jgi:hypothetical protein